MDTMKMKPIWPSYIITETEKVSKRRCNLRRKRMVKRFGKLITASFFVMGLGIVTFLLVIPLYAWFRIDTDILGLIILDIGLIMLIIGIILRRKLRGFKLAVLVVLSAILSIPVWMLIVTTIYFLITGKPMGA